MFNRSKFNRMPFNRVFSVDVTASITMQGVGTLEMYANLDMTATVQMDGIGEMIADAIRERFGSLDLHGIGELSVDAIRERFGSAIMNGIGTMEVNGARFRVDILEFNGEFKPGDRIIIDSKKLKMTLNNLNALPMMQGDFFDLSLGKNEITYSDDQVDRSILIRVTYRERFV
ncbi:phage distal tail protein [Paenibacillus apiarius]|uniref:phage distal tail protein n=1 Tax=Paenibacillus apiarius TaxID=46240 RepID=UPI003B3AF48D